MMDLAIDASRRRLAIVLAGACALLLCAAALAGSARAGVPGVPTAADTEFNTNVAAAGLGGLTNTVFSVAGDTGGKVLVGGAFTAGLKRFNADGTLDTAFNANVATAGLNRDVYSVTVDPHGQILVGGEFTGYLKRFNADGTLDVAFNALASEFSPLDGTVNSVAVAGDGTILVGGDFTGHLRRFAANGQDDSGFDWAVDTRGSLDGTVNSVLVDGNGKILAGGYFGSGLKRFNTDGEVDAPFNTNVAAAGPVTSLALDPRDGAIFAGGSFLGLLERFRANGTLDSAVSKDAPWFFGSQGGVFSVALTAGGVVAVGGTFRGALALFTYNDCGTLGYCLQSRPGAPTPDSWVRSLAYDGGGHLLAGGALTGGLKRFIEGPPPLAMRWPSPGKDGVVSTVIVPQSGVTYTEDASSKLAGSSAVGKKLIKGSCKKIKIKQGKKTVARVSCRIKLTKGKWLVSIRPKKNGVFGIVNSKVYTIKK